MHGRMICDRPFTYLLVYMETWLYMNNMILIITMVIEVLVYIAQYKNDWWSSPVTSDQSPTLGAHAHAHAHQRPRPWVLGGHGCDIFVHGWAWVPYYNGWAWVCERYLAIVNDLLFVRSNQDSVSLEENPLSMTSLMT